MDTWCTGGWKSQFKDCLQQSKIAMLPVCGKVVCKFKSWFKLFIIERMSKYPIRFHKC